MRLALWGVGLPDPTPGQQVPQAAVEVGRVDGHPSLFPGLDGLHDGIAVAGSLQEDQKDPEIQGMQGTVGAHAGSDGMMVSF